MPNVSYKRFNLRNPKNMPISEDSIEQLIDLRRLTFTGQARTIRKAAGLTLNELAGALNVNSSTLWRWENAKRNPKGKNAQDYYRLLQKIDRALKS